MIDPRRDTVYVARSHDGGTVIFDRCGKKLAEYPPLTDEPDARPGDEFAVFYGVVMALSLSLVGFAMVYLAYHVGAALYR
ncbi:hypothetical protein [Methylibium sp.]|uniref:hypothetical protein n=1 Tax=Methylibium sp. TaxID=2067992 RepID=UPI0017BF80C3|nr:hypothetical protein [Methylibium sp.]MBA3588506.1 hypothetical protein [Methylibium sp.]